MSLEALYDHTVTLHHPDGDITFKVETWAGGEATSEDARHRNPNTRRKTARGGVGDRGDLTVTTECDSPLWALKDRMESTRGIDRHTSVRQKISARGVPDGPPDVRVGLVGDVKYPDSDIDGTEVAMLELVLRCDE